MTTPEFDLGRVANIPARRDWDLEITLYTPDATAESAAYATVLAGGDLVRFQLWAVAGEEPIIEATDITPSANGTSIVIETRGEEDTTPARVTIKLTAADTDIAASTYNFILDVQDASDNRWQPACQGKIRITPTPA